MNAEDEEWMNAPLGPPRPTWATQLGVLYDDALLHARAAARGCGYSLARHGSEVRDLDLIAAPWTEDAATPAALAEAVRNAVHGAFTANDPSVRPHGRLTWAIHLKHTSALGDALAASSSHFDPYIDLSVLPPKRHRVAVVAQEAE